MSAINPGVNGPLQRDFCFFQKEKELELTKKVKELSDELWKLGDKNQSLLSDLEEAKKTEQSTAKTYEDKLKVVYWMCGLLFKVYTVCF